jgi:siderophore synthetase component
MNLPAQLPIAIQPPDYLCRRVLDALLREDVRGCISSGELVADPLAMPFASRLSPALPPGDWLRLRLQPAAELWLAVERYHFMQPWRLRALPAVSVDNGRVTPLYALEAVLERFRAGLDADALAQHEAFAAECRTAAEHGRLCERERQRLFEETAGSAAGEGPVDWPAWARSLLRHERLAAFHDHPFYPTARAKLGFSPADLCAYTPEFQPRFMLRWVAVPRARCHGGNPPPGLPWPRFADVGLAEALAESHVLVPVHPRLWNADLEISLREQGLHDEVLRAPLPWLEVTPTLSVRTVAPIVAPQWHLKLPLTMRTLGARNLRTIKPSTITDGALVQDLLGRVASHLPGVGERLLLTDEATGAHVDEQPFLGYILRRYPDGLDDCAVAPVAALAAPAPDGRLVIENLADRCYRGDVLALFQDYIELTVALHLGLWLRAGIALESNQQNSLVVLSPKAPGLRLLLKDNDAPRIHGRFLARHYPSLAPHVEALRDRRIVVDDELPLAQMFTTITLQLNIAVVVEALAEAGRAERRALYARVRTAVARELDALAAGGAETALASRLLLEDPHLYLKYLLRAASLESKASTGASDVNKFYGKTAPNFLRRP